MVCKIVPLRHYQSKAAMQRACSVSQGFQLEESLGLAYGVGGNIFPGQEQSMASTSTCTPLMLVSFSIAGQLGGRAYQTGGRGVTETSGLW